MEDSESFKAAFSSEERENDNPPLDDDDHRSNPESEAPKSQARQPPPADPHLVNDLYRELKHVVDSTAKFEAFSTEQTWESAMVLVRYGIKSLESFRTTDDQARKYLFEDLRKTEKLSFREIALILKLNKHIPPNDQKTSEKEHTLYRA